MGLVEKIKHIIDLAVDSNLDELESSGLGWRIKVTRPHKPNYNSRGSAKSNSQAVDPANEYESPPQTESKEWSTGQLLNYIIERGHIWRPHNDLKTEFDPLPDRYKLVAAYAIGYLGFNNDTQAPHAGDEITKGEKLASVRFSNLEEAFHVKSPKSGNLIIDPTMVQKQLYGKRNEEFPVDYGRIIAVIDTYEHNE